MRSSPLISLLDDYNNIKNYNEGLPLQSLLPSLTGHFSPAVQLGRHVESYALHPAECFVCVPCPAYTHTHTHALCCRIAGILEYFLHTFPCPTNLPNRLKLVEDCMEN